MAKYTIDRPHLPDHQLDSDFGCLCAGCHAPLLAGQYVRDQAIYKLGELDYISVAHARCCPDFDSAHLPQEAGDLGDVPDLNPLALERGDRVRWIGSYGWHTALGPSIPDPRGNGRALFRAILPSGRPGDVSIPIGGIEIETGRL